MLYPLLISIINRIKNLREPDERRERNVLIRKIVSNPRHIVVTRLQNIGDMVAFIPSLLRLRELYPEAKILLMGKHRAGIETIKGAPFIDGILEVERGTLRDKLRLFRRLRKINVDIFIISSQDQGRVPWALFFGAKLVVAFDQVKRYGNKSNEKLRFLISLKAKYRSDLSDAENNLRLIGALGGDISTTTTRFDWVKEEDKKSLDSELDEFLSSHKGPLVVFCPGTKRPSRAWPNSNFREMAIRLNRKFGAKIIVIGTERERETNERICDSAPFMTNLAGKTSIQALGYLFSKVDLVITVDSGPMHIAAAVGVPTVALFGPGDYQVWKPYCKKQDCMVIVRHLVQCSPCLYYKCPRASHECMEGISVETVLMESQRLLARFQKVALL